MNYFFSFVFLSIFLTKTSVGQVVCNKDEMTAEMAKTCFDQRSYIDINKIIFIENSVFIYKNLIKQATSNPHLFYQRIRLSEALFYEGDIKAFLETKDLYEDVSDSPNKQIIEQIKAIHLSGIEFVEPIIETYKERNNLSEEEALLFNDAIYFKGINLASWARANGKLSSLSKWQEISGLMIQIISNKQESRYQFGAYRVLGRGLNRIPFASQSAALFYLKEAFEKTLVSTVKLSNNGANIIFLAQLLLEKFENTKEVNIDETLIDGRKVTMQITFNGFSGKEYGCDLLKKYIQVNLNELEPSVLADNQRMQRAAKKLFTRSSCQ